VTRNDKTILGRDPFGLGPKSSLRKLLTELELTAEAIDLADLVGLKAWVAAQEQSGVR